MDQRECPKCSHKWIPRVENVKKCPRCNLSLTSERPKYSHVVAMLDTLVNSKAIIDGCECTEGKMCELCEMLTMAGAIVDKAKGKKHEIP